MQNISQNAHTRGNRQRRKKLRTCVNAKKKRKAYYNHSKVILKANSSKVKSLSFPHYDSDELMLENIFCSSLKYPVLFVPSDGDDITVLLNFARILTFTEINSLSRVEFYFRSSSRLLELKHSTRER